MEMTRPYRAMDSPRATKIRLLPKVLGFSLLAAMAAGAIGARMIGGGFGGSAIALIDADDADVVGAAVTAAFAEAGFAAPDIFAVSAGRGAGRIG